MTARRMRSGAVALGMVSSLALALTSCDSEADKRCVDTTNYRTVADKLCKSAPGGGYADTDRYQWYQKGGTSTGLAGYHRYYGSSSGSGSKGSTDKTGTGKSSTGKGVTRGGLGSHGSGSSGS
ncbi:MULTISPECIES: hypothetical protein [Streptacidiphilus]|uniref:Lipoprotein n=1 Tax=Streptacidiphilus cavernicola TaxID=3342716 RepID=A0ABV6UTK3_9ACTN|nr:hypothetical protein [Streptacidiphilus jeojiense]